MLNSRQRKKRFIIIWIRAVSGAQINMLLALCVPTCSLSICNVGMNSCGIYENYMLNRLIKLKFLIVIGV